MNSQSKHWCLRALSTGTLACSLLGTTLFGAGVPTAAAASCDVVYTPNQWSNGFTAEVTIRNSGAAISGWTLIWNFAGNQQVSNAWNAIVTQSGTQVTARNIDWNGTIPSNGSVGFGFQASYSGSNPSPTSFTLNGVVCGGTSTPTPVTATATRTTVPATATRTTVPATATPATRTATPVVPTATPGGGNNNDDWLHTSGNRIVDSVGNPVWLTGVNWFGFNATERVFHGLWSANLEQMIKAVTERGINILRVPISTQLILEWKAGDFRPVNVNTNANPSLTGMNSLQIFDETLRLSKIYGLKIMIDVHSAEADNSGHVYPVWYKGTITSEQFYQAWEWITNRYKNDDTVVAMDIKNEPHGNINAASQGLAKWDGSTDIDNWKHACETASRRILAINPNVLVLCEGNETYPKPGFTYGATDPKSYYNTWWGGNLRGVRDYPINLGANQDQLVYSPHDYGPLVFQQPWFYAGFTKETLYNDVWRDNWFFIHEQNIAPLLIGEWGGFMDGGDNEKWMRALRDFMIENKLHHTFWCLNPNSGDTGGLLGYDWATWDEAKYNLLKPSLWQDRAGKFVSLDHQVPLGNSSVGTTVTAYYASGNPAPVGP